VIGQAAAGAGEAARFRHPGRRVVGGADDPVGHGVLVEAADGGDEVFRGAAPTACVTPYHDVVPSGVGSSRRRVPSVTAAETFAM
jgi:hypothetical protein